MVAHRLDLQSLCQRDRVRFISCHLPLLRSTFAPKSSHFYAPHDLGCEATLASFPEWQLEDDRLFNAMLPDAAGACPAGFLPLYRLYNNGMGGAPNHRFVISLGEQISMVNPGWIAEGPGIGVGMCVPQ